MSGSGREALADVREWLESLPDVRGSSGLPPGCPGVVGSPSRVVGRPTQMFGRDQESLSDVRERSGGPP